MTMSYTEPAFCPDCHEPTSLCQCGEPVARPDYDAVAAECAALRKDAERLDWIEENLIEGKWDGTIGRPKSWVMVGPYRHTLQKMRGDSLREAIDAAMGESHE